MITIKLALAFEDAVAAVFQSQGFSVIREPMRSPGVGRKPRPVDLFLEKDGVESVVEVKFYRSRTPSPSDLLRAAQSLASARSDYGASHALLILNLDAKLLPEFDEGLGIEVIGIDQLMVLAERENHLLDQLTNIVRELNSGLRDFERSINVPSASTVDAVLQSLSQPLTAPVEASPALEDTGHKLAADLREITPGGKEHQTLPSRKSGVGWRLLEIVGLESLRYVLGDEMGSWRAQEAVGGDDKRFDALAKVRGDDVFCRTLIEDFRSRYVLFEFKNYSAPLAPNPLYITEKYLFPTALRSTGIVISPFGFSQKATETARGALRDSAKLILDLPLPKLCEMLENKDRGDPAGLTMEVLLDEFLQTMGR